MRKLLPILLICLFLLPSCMQGHYGDAMQGFSDGVARGQAMNQGAYTYNTYLAEQQLRESREAAEQQRQQLERLQNSLRDMEFQQEQQRFQQMQERHQLMFRPYY